MVKREIERGGEREKFFFFFYKSLNILIEEKGSEK